MVMNSHFRDGRESRFDPELSVTKQYADLTHGRDSRSLSQYHYRTDPSYYYDSNQNAVVITQDEMHFDIFFFMHS